MLRNLAGLGVGLGVLVFRVFKLGVGSGFSCVGC